MKRKKNKKVETELNYWQPLSDVMSALLLSLLLIIMLLILYVVRTPDEELIDWWIGEHEYDYVPENDAWSRDIDDQWDAVDWHSEDRTDNDSSGGGGGYGGYGGYQSDDIAEERDEYIDDDPRENDFPEYGKGDYRGDGKAAVHVTVVDAETGRSIKTPDIVFELYDRAGNQQLLNDYYPEKVSYRQFATTEAGAFFLPEKIWMGGYTLRELNEPYGYDATEDLDFSVDESHDWDEPYALQVPLYPSRSYIRMQVLDMDTNEPVPGGTYDIVAAADISTADGTLRCSEGQIVDRMTMDETGCAQSKELFLGPYIIRQSVIPSYYSSLRQDHDVQLPKLARGLEPGLHAFNCERTSYTLELCDELYNNIRLKDVSFSVSKEGDASEETLQTDENGQIILDRLEKNTTYHIRQKEILEGYHGDGEEIVFTVSDDGRIEERAKATQRVTNRTMRLSIGIRDVFFHGLLTDYNVTLYDAQGELVKRWISTAIVETTVGLEPGDYRVVVGGSGGMEKTFTLEDIADVQTIHCDVWTNQSIAAVAGIAVGVLGGVALLIFAIRRKKTT